MQTKDEEIFNLIDSIGQHYRTNLGNRYVRNAFSVLPLDAKEWGLIESVTEKAEYYRYQGYHMDELYERILALARFIYHGRRELAPQLRARLSTYSSGPGPLGTDKILRDMAVNNFASNLSILADLVNQLYQRTVQIDQELARGKTPVYKKMRELEELGTYLVPA
ncbi:MAG: hypothetical protein ACOC1U_04715 [Spirochaetota bacterium]